MSAEADMSMGDTPNRQAYSSNKTNEAAFAVLDELRQQNQLCDVIIRVGDQDFVAHRVVLAATCPYFKGMFTGEIEAGVANVLYFQTHAGIRHSCL